MDETTEKYMAMIPEGFCWKWFVFHIDHISTSNPLASSDSLDELIERFQGRTDVIFVGAPAPKM